MSQPSAIVGLAFVDDQLWSVRENGLLVHHGAQSTSIQLEPEPVGLVSETGQLWVWGRQQLTRIDANAAIVSQQPARPCHTLCQRGHLLWTASNHEICCYHLTENGWELLRQFDGLKGSCLSFDVSHNGQQFLRIWPGQGNRWHLATYDALSGELKSEFKRGALWLQAVFSPDDFSLMVTGWSPQQLTAISFSGGHCSDRHRLISCAWAGPLYHFDQRIVAICQGGLQSYDCQSFPPGRPEYACTQGYEASPHWVIPVGSKWQNHKWYPRYANRLVPRIQYAQCPVTAVASGGSIIAVGFQDGTLQLYDVSSTAAPRIRDLQCPSGRSDAYEQSETLSGTYPAVSGGIPVRAFGQSDHSLLLLNPRDKQLVEIPVTPGDISLGTKLELDDYWPHSASEWGQLYRSQEYRLLLRDRYGVQSFKLRDGRLLWKVERSEWSLTTRLLPWRDRLYLDQASRGLAWLDPKDGSQHQDSNCGEGRFRLYQLGDQFLLQSQVGAATHWSVYNPEAEQVQSLELGISWCDAAVSNCQRFITFTRHHAPEGQQDNLLLLDISNGEERHFNIPWCAQVQAEPSLQLIFGVAIQRLMVYNFEGNLVHCFQGHGGAIVGFRVDREARWVLSWDEFGWVRRWSF